MLTIEDRNKDVFQWTSGGSFGSVLDSHAGGPGSIPSHDGGGCTAENGGGIEGWSKEEAAGWMTAARKP